MELGPVGLLLEEDSFFYGSRPAVIVHMEEVPD